MYLFCSLMKHKAFSGTGLNMGANIFTLLHPMGHTYIHILMGWGEVINNVSNIVDMCVGV